MPMMLKQSFIVVAVTIVVMLVRTHANASLPSGDEIEQTVRHEPWKIETFGHNDDTTNEHGKLERALTTPRRCKKLDKAIQQYDSQQGGGEPIRVDELKGRNCSGVAFPSNKVILSYHGNTDDKVELYTWTAAGEVLRHTSFQPTDYPRVQLFVVDQAEPIVLRVEQAELDVPWYVFRKAKDNESLRRRSSRCVELTLDEAEAHLTVDGKSLTTLSSSTQSSAKIDLPEGHHVVDFGGVVKLIDVAAADGVEEQCQSVRFNKSIDQSYGAAILGTLYEDFEYLLRLRDWRTMLAFDDRTAETPDGLTFTNLLNQAQPHPKCKTQIDKLIEKFHKNPNSLELDTLMQLDACNGVFGDDLKLSDRVLLTYDGGQGDTVTVYDSLTTKIVPWSPEGFSHIQVFLVERAKTYLVRVQQPEYDIAWQAVVKHNYDYVIPRLESMNRTRPNGCLDIAVNRGGSAEATSPPLLLVDGQKLEMRALDGGTYHQIIRVPEGEHDVRVFRNENLRDEVQSERFVAETIYVSYSNQCVSRSYDLDEHEDNYGIGRLSIADACRPYVSEAGINEYLQHRLEDDGKKLVPLLELEGLQAILSSLPKDIPRVSEQPYLDDRLRLAAMFGEYIRQGVGKFMVLDVQCHGDEVTLTGTLIDLDKYTKASKSRSAGVELSGSIRTYSSTRPRQRLRGAFDEVIGRFLNKPYITMDSRTVWGRDRGSKQQLEVAGHDGIRVMAIDADQCARVQRYNTLTPGAEVPRAVPRGARAFTQVYPITLTRGRWLTMATHPDAPVSYGCLDVREPRTEGHISIDGGRRERGRNADTNLRHERIDGMRILGGARWRPSAHFSMSADIGYDLTRYTAPTTNGWSQGVLPTAWNRHGAIFGGSFGARFPFSVCEWGHCPSRPNWRRPYISTRFEAFVDQYIVLNVGFVSTLRPLPPDDAGNVVFQRSLIVMPDLDLGTRIGIRAAVTGRSWIALFLGIWNTDVSSLITKRFLPDTLGRIDYDWSTRVTFGMEYAFTPRVEKQ